jgi:hypothetical protein
MSEYRLVPDEGSFPDEALSEWRAFLLRLPSRQRISDGVFQIFASVEERDEFERNVVAAHGRELCLTADHVRLQRDFIDYELVERCVDAKQLSSFLRSFHRRWPFRILDEGAQQLTIAEFVVQATFEPAP